MAASSWTRLGLAVGPALMLAALLNGLSTHLKLVGLWEPKGYEAYWQLHCLGGATTAEPIGVGRRCETPDLANPPRISHRLGAEYALGVGRPDLWLKRAKDVFVFFLVALSLILAPKAGWGATGGRVPLPAVLLTLVAALGFLRVATQGDGLALMAGARSTLFLVVALTTGGFIAAEGLSRVALWVAGLLWVQLAFIPPQLLFGIPVHGYLPFLHLPRRMAGTFSLPNSLGVFAVVGFAFASSYLPGRRRWPLFVVCVVLVWISGSATGVVALLWWVASTAFRAAPKRSRIHVALLSALVASAVLTALPGLLGRQTVFQGVFGTSGRLISLKHLLVAMDAPLLIVGEGLGRGTNALVSLSGIRSLGSGDSTVTTLVHQIGLVGLAAFYLLLAWAWRRDRMSRPFYEVLGLCSLTLAMTELFPANVLLGLALGRSLWHTADHWSRNEGG